MRSRSSSNNSTERVLVWDRRSNSFHAPTSGQRQCPHWQFVAGGLPLSLLIQAYTLGQRAMLSVLLIHTASWIRERHSHAWITVPSREYARFGLDSSAWSKTIARLEESGLIEVQRRGRRLLTIRVSPSPAS